MIQSKSPFLHPEVRMKRATKQKSQSNHWICSQDSDHLFRHEAEPDISEFPQKSAVVPENATKHPGPK